MPVSSKLAHSVRTKLEFREGVNFVVKFAAVTASFCAQTIYRVWLVGLWFDVAFYYLTNIPYWFQNGKYRSTRCCNYLRVVIRESNPTDVQVRHISLKDWQSYRPPTTELWKWGWTAEFCTSTKVCWMRGALTVAFSSRCTSTVALWTRLNGTSKKKILAWNLFWVCFDHVS